MKLYLYEHCPFCNRVVLAAGLKKIALEQIVIMEGDTETPIKLMGKKGVPILEKADGSHMSESLDIVKYLDELGTPMFDSPDNEAIEQWLQHNWNEIVRLIVPRFTEGDFKEISTSESRAYFKQRETKVFGDLNELIQRTPEFLLKINGSLEVLEELVLNRDGVGIWDIKLWPILRSLTMVKGIEFPEKIREYTQTLADEAQIKLLYDQAI